MQRLLLIIGLVLSFLLASSCSRLFYYPDGYLHIPLEKVGLSGSDHWFNSQDGTKLNAWLVTDPARKEKTRGLFVLFHGNAENLSSHHYNMNWAVKAGFDLFIFDYRGYGRSEGKPNPEGVIEDGVAALQYAHTHIMPELKKKNPKASFVVIGQSIGGMIAPQSLVQSNLRPHVDLLVLEATFASYRALAKKKLQSNWLTWIFWPIGQAIVHESTASKFVLPTLDSPPVIVIHGTADVVIPIKMGREVFNLLPEQNRQWWESPGANHLQALYNNKALQEKLLSILPK